MVETIRQYYSEIKTLTESTKAVLHKFATHTRKFYRLCPHISNHNNRFLHVGQHKYFKDIKKMVSKLYSIKMVRFV